MEKIGIIGAGKVGVSLGRCWSGLEGLDLIGYYSRTKESSEYAAQLTNSISFDGLKDLVYKCNVIIIASPDDSIGDIWRQISIFNVQNKIIAHCSGSLSSEIFFDSSKLGASVCSLHPVLAVSSKEDSYKDLKKAFFTLEGDQVAVDFFAKILDIQKNPYKIIRSCDKTKYHISTVFMSNLIVAISNIASDLLRSYDFTEEEALLALSSLAKNNMENVFEKGLVSSLTGPVERNDTNTVTRHLRSLESQGQEGKLGQIYRLLSLELVKIAQIKNSNRNYEGMRKILSKEEDL